MELIKDYIRPKSSEYSNNDNVRYLVMATGYTARLLERLDEINRIFEEELTFCPEFLDVEFIYDKDDGEGLYIKKNYNKELVDFILSDIDSNHAIVVFSTDKNMPRFMFMDLAKEIVDLDYCDNQKIVDMSVSELNGSKILYIYYDSE